MASCCRAPRLTTRRSSNGCGAPVWWTRRRGSTRPSSPTLGMSFETIDEWDRLTHDQQAFLRTLRRLAGARGTEAMSARAADRPGQVRARSRIPGGSACCPPVPTTERGRLDHMVTDSATQTSGAESLEPSPRHRSSWRSNSSRCQRAMNGASRAIYAPLLRTPLEDVNRDLDADDTHRKGIALELLALRLATDSGLTPLRFRLRAATTGGAEVDLIAEGAHLLFSRWLFQCKNTRSVSLADLAKEVGMAVMLRAHVIVLVTTGRFAASVPTYATELMLANPLQVVLIDHTVLICTAYVVFDR